MCFGTRIRLVFTHWSMFSEIATLLFGLQGWIINKLLRQSGDFKVDCKSGAARLFACTLA